MSGAFNAWGAVPEGRRGVAGCDPKKGRVRPPKLQGWVQGATPKKVQGATCTAQGRKRKQGLSFPKGTGDMRGPSPQTGTAFAFKLASCWKGRATPSGMVQVGRPAELEGGAGRQGQGAKPTV